MPLGPGKHDHYLTPVMQETDAFASILIVVGMDGENSFCVQAVKDVTAFLPSLLRMTADEIERTTKNEGPTIPPVESDRGDSIPDQASGAV